MCSHSTVFMLTQCLRKKFPRLNDSALVLSICRLGKFFRTWKATSSWPWVMRFRHRFIASTIRINSCIYQSHHQKQEKIWDFFFLLQECCKTWNVCMLTWDVAPLVAQTLHYPWDMLLVSSLGQGEDDMHNISVHETAVCILCFFQSLSDQQRKQRAIEV